LLIPEPERFNFEFAVEMSKNADQSRKSTDKRKVSALESDLTLSLSSKCPKTLTKAVNRPTNAR
jgi:hypothetical protein